MNTGALNSLLGYLNNAAASYKRVQKDLKDAGVSKETMEVFENSLIQAGESAAALKEEARQLTSPNVPEL